MALKLRLKAYIKRFKSMRESMGEFVSFITIISEFKGHIIADTAEEKR
jgi:hypothetical protein